MTNDFTAPEGWVATEISEDVIVLKRADESKEEPQRSKTWEEFCEKNNVMSDEAYIDDDGDIVLNDHPRTRHISDDRVYIPSRYAKPMLALMQLLTIREKEYIPEEWEPDVEDEFWVIGSNIYGDIVTHKCAILNYVLSFPTEALTREFFDTWRDLIEKAKPLL